MWRIPGPHVADPKTAWGGFFQKRERIPHNCTMQLSLLKKIWKRRGNVSQSLISGPTRLVFSGEGSLSIWLNNQVTINTVWARKPTISGLQTQEPCFLLFFSNWTTSRAFTRSIKTRSSRWGQSERTAWKPRSRWLRSGRRPWLKWIKSTENGFSF